MTIYLGTVLAVFQRARVKLYDTVGLIYFLIFSDDIEETLHSLTPVLGGARSTGFSLHYKKCNFSS